MIVPARFNGPPDSANGGYAAGLVAQVVLGADPSTVVADRAVRVTLRRPPPLETTLLVDADPATGAVRLTVDAPAGAVLVAEAEPVVGPDLSTGPVPPPVALADAEAASTAYPGFTAHPFPGCYVCGPRHPDGLRIFPGPTGPGRTAAPFVVPADRTVPTVWAALDCPGGWAVLTPGRPYLLGRMSATVAALPDPGARCVVVGELVATSGRKAEVRTALYDPAGHLLAVAQATWIAVAAGGAGEPV
ncbi:hypothetical protein O7623_27355 [Solwaraspora sp. WMMD791]|uniref:hypothetical protein n=1 Tax=Solwaraspora sp. WMMD791 TaxID=3016086 RepID=UPI00249AD48D|nr:hypothetical protein [Solwaraspora sp. WMMD791]WFE26942.1 hypothetical protein O7623_27355 [Solwaraspora sp. WMMD791]